MNSTTIAALQAELQEKATATSATYFGVADLAPVKEFVTGQGDDFLAEFPVGISVGAALADGIVDQLYQHSNADIARLHRYHTHTAIAELLDRAATTVALRIEQEGYRAMVVPSSSFYNAAKLAGVVSHKLIAHLGGIGWIGKNCLLITKTHGPRVRFATVLTDAPLASTAERADPDPCKRCRLCVELCPVQAFTGVGFRPEDPVDVRFRRQLCHEYLAERERTVGTQSCGIYVHVCPHGWSIKRKKQGRRTNPQQLRRDLGMVVRARV